MAKTKNQKIKEKIKLSRDAQRSEAECIIDIMETLVKNLTLPNIDAGNAKYALPILKKAMNSLDSWHKKELFYKERFLPFVNELRAAKRFRPKEENTVTKIQTKTNQITLPEIPSIYTADKILNIVCSSLLVDVESVISPSRKKYVSQARFITIGISLRIGRKITLEDLGKLLNRDHSTIIYGKQLFNDLYMYNKEFKEKTDKVISHLVAA